ncbi:MAG: hypothetical protein ACI9BD_001112, partial [Candidatus Marinamargulisbacteria bacterium]
MSRVSVLPVPRDPRLSGGDERTVYQSDRYSRPPSYYGGNTSAPVMDLSYQQKLAYQQQMEFQTYQNQIAYQRQMEYQAYQAHQHQLAYQHYLASLPPEEAPLVIDKKPTQFDPSSTAFTPTGFASTLDISGFGPEEVPSKSLSLKLDEVDLKPKVDLKPTVDVDALEAQLGGLQVSQVSADDLVAKIGADVEAAEEEVAFVSAWNVATPRDEVPVYHPRKIYGSLTSINGTQPQRGGTIKAVHNDGYAIWDHSTYSPCRMASCFAKLTRQTLGGKSAPFDSAKDHLKTHRGYDQRADEFGNTNDSFGHAIAAMLFGDKSGKKTEFGGNGWFNGFAQNRLENCQSYNDAEDHVKDIVEAHGSAELYIKLHYAADSERPVGVSYNIYFTDQGSGDKMYVHYSFDNP